MFDWQTFGGICGAAIAAALVMRVVFAFGLSRWGRFPDTEAKKLATGIGCLFAAAMIVIYLLVALHVLG